MHSFLYRLATTLGRPQKQMILLASDVVQAPVCLVLACWLQGWGVRDLGQGGNAAALMLGLMAAAGVCSVVLGLPRIKLNAYEQQGIFRTIGASVLVGGAGLWIVRMTMGSSFVGASVPVLAVFTMALTLSTVLSRLILRHVLLAVLRRDQPAQRILIYGAGQTGLQLVNALATDPTVVPVCFVDDDRALHRSTIAGLPVHAPDQIAHLVRTRRIDRVVLAMPSISRPRQMRIARTLADLQVEVRALPSFAALVGTGHLLERTEPVRPEDFLNRERLERELICGDGIYAGKTVMITGAGGSIGSELCRQILEFDPRTVVLVETNELALYQIERELAETAGKSGPGIVPVLGSVTDGPLMRRILADHAVEIVIHAAAYKHVTMVERNQLAGIRNNVFGTKVLAEAARDARVTHFILISTDKAVRPSSVMGASKRVAELVLLDYATRSERTGGPKFAIVRFGNVLGSSGSVIPLFREQIARGGPVTLTHADVTRFFMTTGEAVRLTLLAGSLTKGGDLFILDMGSPVSIQTLARQMIARANYTVRDETNPLGDIDIVITGLRPGEKLHEDLSHSTDLAPTPHPKILRAREDVLSEIEIATCLRSLSSAIDVGDVGAALLVLHRWVGIDARPDPAVVNLQAGQS